jgi:hypothetical protein
LTDEELATPKRAFGKESRRELLNQYFSRYKTVEPQDAWKHVYRLLLWIDKTTGLAHCYESDKSQPGRPWYARSLAFHSWLSSELQSKPEVLGEELDWLFAHGSERLAVSLLRLNERRAAIAKDQRTSFPGFPEPGEDPGFESIVLEELKPALAGAPSSEVMRRLTQRVRTYFSQENKRKNLLGEGFEDVLAFLLERLPRSSRIKVHVRPRLHELPGFRKPAKKQKRKTVDLAIVGRTERRTLVTAKWSVRADREEQFSSDFEAYAKLDEASQNFDYVLVTNEFDAARLLAACERRAQNTNLFAAVVHVNPKGPLEAYGSTGRGAALDLKRLISSGRLLSLETWLKGLLAA